MSNGWTGGQYSLYRVIFGTYLLIHFAMLLPWGTELFSNEGLLPDASASPLARLFPNILAVADSPAMVATLLVAAMVASILFLIGAFDRAAAIFIAYVLACLFGRNPLIANPSLPFVGWLLVAHAFLPPAPYGSVAARGRVDPRGSWRMPSSIFAAAWTVMALGYSYSGYTKLISPSWVDGTALGRVMANPLARPTLLREIALATPDPILRLATWGTLALELLYAPLALMRHVRPWIWLLMLLLHLGLMMLIDFADLSFGMVVLHLFTFDPAWVKPLRAGVTERLFYDGSCGLCHRAIRFIIAEDTRDAFRFAPLGGEEFAALVKDPPDADTVIVQREDGRLLVKSEAALHVLARLGGAWRVLAAVGRGVPRGLRDVIYDFIAGIRYRLFARPKDVCPILPPDLRGRFGG